MRLYEFEGKQLLRKANIAVPKGYFVSYSEMGAVGADPQLERIFDDLGGEGVVVKAQVLAGKRGKAGGIRFAHSPEELQEIIEAMVGNELLGELVTGVLIEEKAAIAQEYYISLTYDTVNREPVLAISKEGGVDVETFAREHPDQLILKRFGPIVGLMPWMARDAAVRAGFRGRELRNLAGIAVKMWNVMVQADARLVEINPLVRTQNGELVALDAALLLDSDAQVRHPELNLPPRQATGRPLTERELVAQAIDEGDYRGVAGKYVELEGDIGMLTSGGGGSITLMDAVAAFGGKPANYTEYGGNPPAEKVYRLTKVVATKPGLHGLLIAGGIANNTRVDVTFEGIARALAEIRPEYPIVIRRAGPGEEEGLQLMRDLARREGLDIEVYGADLLMTEAARIVVEKAAAYRQKLEV
jgi:citryl-CoA synthetase large subunit